ncbi:MAG: hypothetical protein AB7V27_03440 [Candidatus Binatia bacterium]
MTTSSPPDRAGRERQPRRAATSTPSHLIPCPLCQTEFDLFAAVWCPHIELEPSKICPSCAQCLCDHPAYREPNFWKEAPLVFRQHGFQRLFLYYL